MAGLNAQLSPLTISAWTGASTASPSRLPALVLNREGVYYGLLPVLEADSDNALSENTSLATDPLYPTYLPALELSAQGETFLYSLTGLRLPGLTLSVSMGLSVAADLPALTIAATGAYVQSLNLNRSLPGLQLDARTGIICGTLNLPTLELEISGTGDLVGRLDRSIPGLTISAAGSSDFLGTLDRRLPPLELTIAMSGTNAGTLSKSLPALMIAAGASLNDYGILDVDLPGLIASAMAGHGSSMSLDAELPALLMQIMASGGFSGGPASVASNASRFTDYILRHVR